MRVSTAIFGRFHFSLDRAFINPCSSWADPAFEQGTGPLQGHPAAARGYLWEPAPSLSSEKVRAPCNGTPRHNLEGDCNAHRQIGYGPSDARGSEPPVYPPKCRKRDLLSERDSRTLTSRRKPRLNLWQAIDEPGRASGDTRDITIEVRDEHGQRVLTVRVTMEINRVAPPPIAPGGAREVPADSRKPLYGTALAQL